jgi:hypothetical protein
LWSRRSRVRIPSLTLRDSLQTGTIGRSGEGASSATGSSSGSNVGFEQAPTTHHHDLGDEAELFQNVHRRLTRIVRSLVNTSPDIVDDACNYAWMEFIRHQPDRDGGWRAWLVTTAQREAWRLDGRERAHVGFEVEGHRDEFTREPADPRDVVTSGPSCDSPWTSSRPFLDAA